MQGSPAVGQEHGLADPNKGGANLVAKGVDLDAVYYKNSNSVLPASRRKPTLA